MFMKPRKPYLSCKSCKWESSLKRLSSVPADSSRSENQSWRQGQASSPALQELSWAVLFPPWLQAQALSTLQLEGLCHVCSVTTHRTHQLLTCRWTDTGSSRSESCRLEGGTSGPLRPLPVPLLLLPCPPLPSYRWGLDTAPHSPTGCQKYQRPWVKGSSKKGIFMQQGRAWDLNLTLGWCQPALGLEA